MEEIIQNTEQRNFSELYYRLRQLEGRVYSDAEVLNLPDINASHQHCKEWRIRKQSSLQLISYLSAKSKPLQILEVGCGNGWLSNKLSSLPSARVTGIDINKEELNQAKRVFGNSQNLDFYLCSLEDEKLKNSQFDIIVFAASIQYFPSLYNILEESIRHLKAGGEIHLMDSILYKRNELPSARQRSDAYYACIGFAEMKQYYFHHGLDELNFFAYTIKRRPNSASWINFKNKSPFYWICIKQK